MNVFQSLDRKTITDFFFFMCWFMWYCKITLNVKRVVNKINYKLNRLPSKIRWEIGQRHII